MLIQASRTRSAVGRIRPSEGADARMQMFNADGSESEMCGNGVRCVAKYAWDHGLARRNPMRVETDSGVKTVDLEFADGLVSSVAVDMGPPIFDPAQVPIAASSKMIDAPLAIDGHDLRITCVSMGNPHCVIFVDSTADAPVTTLGPKIEVHPLFPQRVNVEFVQLLAPAPADRLRMRVWERGSGETAACGTGACAVAVAAALTGRGRRSVVVELAGGDLRIDWREADDHVIMTGGATEVFTGEIEL